MTRAEQPVLDARGVALDAWPAARSRSFAGMTASISCVSAPNAQMRPQYSRPQSTVETTTNTAKQVPGEVVLEDRQVPDRATPKMLTIEISWLFENPR